MNIFEQRWIDRETKEHVEQLPEALVEMWHLRKDSNVATLIGINAVKGVANLSGFTEYCERLLEDLDEDL